MGLYLTAQVEALALLEWVKKFAAAYIEVERETDQEGATP